MITDSKNQLKSESISKIAELFTKCSTFAVISHYNPDADAYGSSSALYLALKGLGKSVILVNESGLVDRYSWIPGVSDVKSRLISSAEYPECIVVCDCGALERVGDTLKEYVRKAPLVVNIDHHISNEEFGHLNFVDLLASSTSEAIYSILSLFDTYSQAISNKNISSILTADVATSLLTGIYGDTGSFRYGSTTQRTFEVALELVKRGAIPHHIASNLYSQVSIASTKLQSAALLEMEMHENGKIAEIVLSKAHYAKYSAQDEDMTILAERARDISGVIISVLIREDDGIWRVSLRAKDSRINLSDIASHFGGGGHKSASAFRSRRRLEEIRSDLLGLLKDALDKI